MTRSWELALDAAEARRPIVLQHLLLAINAHVNLDLGIAAAETAPGDALPSLRRDFDRINEIIASLIAGVRHDLATISPWIGLLDRLGGRHDDEIIRFSMEVARTEACASPSSWRRWRTMIGRARSPPRCPGRSRRQRRAQAWLVDGGAAAHSRP